MKRIPKWLSTGLKVALSIAALTYVGFKLWIEREALVGIWSRLGPGDFGWILGAGLLIFLNMGLEAAKWRFLLQPFYPKVSLWRALKGVLAGMATGIFTPNRIGAYAGRLLILEAGHRVEAGVVTLVDRLCQMLVTMVVGLLAVQATSDYRMEMLMEDVFGSSDILGIFALIAVALLIILAVVIMFPGVILGPIFRLFPNKSWYQKLQLVQQTLTKWRSQIVVGLAMLRYLVFSTQFLFLLYGFGYSGDVMDAYWMISLLFLAKSVIPFLGFTELGVRESIAIEVFGLIGISAATSISATFILYLFNIILPSLVGVIFLRELNLEQEEVKAP